MMKTSNLKILIVDDNPGDIRLCREMLEESNTVSWKVEEAHDMAGGKKKAAKTQFDLIVLDLNLPDSEGIHTFQEIRSSAKHTPIVILSGRADQALAAVQDGAEDYLNKDQLTPSLLSRAFQYAIERSRLKQQLQSLSITDELSGLLNRQGFLTMAEQQIKLAKRSLNPMTLFFIDIDHMKGINDSLGHKKGDLAIQAAARVLQLNFRESDLIARMGGDEFAVLAIDSDPDQQEMICQRLMETIDQVKIEQNLPFDLSLSIGTAVWSAGETQDLDLLLQQADRAMYTQKGKTEVFPLPDPINGVPFIEKPPFILDRMNLLLIEDNPGDARLVKEFLTDSKREIHITRIERLSEIKDLDERKDFSIILLDLSLPDSQGIDTLKKVSKLFPLIPIVVFTGQDDSELALTAIQGGAQDYLVKGLFDDVVLERALHYSMERHALHQQNQEFLGEIQHSELILKSIFDHVKIGIFRTDREGILTFANRGMMDMLGYDSLSQVSGANFLVEHLHLEPEFITRLFTGEQQLKGGLTLLYTRSGEIISIRLGITLTAFEGQTILTGTVEDISLQIESQRQLHLQSSALEATANAIVITDTEGIILWNNQAFCDLTGYQKDDVIGKSTRILKSGKHDNDFYQSMWESISSGRVWQGELTNLRKNGTSYIERMTITPIRGNNEKISHYIAIKEDITLYKQSQKTLQRRLAEVTALNQIALAGIEETDEDELITRVTRIGQEMIYSSHFGVLLLSEKGEDLFLHPSYLGVSEVWFGKSFSIHKGVVGRVVKSNSTVIISDISQEEDYLPSTPNIRSELAVPLIVDNKLIGVINAESTEPGTFQKDDARLLETIAGQLGTALNQIRANKKEREQRQIAEALSDIALALNSSLEINQVLDQILEKIAMLVPYKTAALYLRQNGNANVIRHKGYEALGLGEWIENFSVSLKGGSDLPSFQQLVDNNKPFLIADTELHPGWVVLPETAWIRSYLGIPIYKGEEVIGFINLDQDFPNAFTETHIQIMDALSNQIATALENAELYRLQKEQLDFLESLRQIDYAITGSLDIQLTLSVITAEVKDRLKIDAVNILLYDPASFQFQVIAKQGFNFSNNARESYFPVTGILGQLINQRSSQEILDLGSSDFVLDRKELLTRERFVSYFGIPLIAKGKIIGVMELFRRETIDFIPEWKKYAETVGTQTAIAINNSQLFSDLQKANLELSQAYDTTLEGWAGALELRDHETEGHSRRVVDLTMDLVKVMELPEEKWIHIRRGALLHDIGKMGVPDSILQKSGKLTEEEWELMRQHPLYALKWLKPIQYLQQAMPIPHYHHERYDGTGYPEGLTGEEIPLEARIFAVIDVWDALMSDRPYRKAWSRTKVLDHIKTEAGKHFDPRVVDAFIKLIQSNS